MLHIPSFKHVQSVRTTDRSTRSPRLSPTRINHGEKLCTLPYPNRSSATKNPWHPPPLPLDHRSHSYPFIRRHLKKNTLKTLHDAVHTSCITQEITCPFECVTCPSPRGEHDGGTETRIPEGQPREQPTTLQLSNTRGLDTRAILLMQQNHHSYDSRKDKKKRKQTGQTKP